MSGEELEKSTGDKNFVAPETGGQQPEQEAEEELTLEEQADIYAEMFGVDQAVILEAAQGLQTEMSEDERRELTMLVYGKKGTTTALAWEVVKAKSPAWSSLELARIKVEGETDKAFVAFMHYAQEADEDSLGVGARYAINWEQTNAKYASPKHLMIAREFYRRAEGKQMDEKNQTMCPRSRSKDGHVPYLNLDSDDGRVYLRDIGSTTRYPILGVRREVSKEL